MLDSLKKWVPITYEAFMDYRVGGTEVSAKGKVIIQKLIKGQEVSVDSSGLSKREWNELMIAFDLKEKLFKLDLSLKLKNKIIILKIII